MSPPVFVSYNNFNLCFLQWLSHNSQRDEKHGIITVREMKSMELTFFYLLTMQCSKSVVMSSHVTTGKLFWRQPWYYWRQALSAEYIYNFLNFENRTIIDGDMAKNVQVGKNTLLEILGPVHSMRHCLLNSLDFVFIFLFI